VTARREWRVPRVLTWIRKWSYTFLPRSLGFKIPAPTHPQQHRSLRSFFYSLCFAVNSLSCPFQLMIRIIWVWRTQLVMRCLEARIPPPSPAVSLFSVPQSCPSDDVQKLCGPVVMVRLPSGDLQMLKRYPSFLSFLRFKTSARQISAPVST